MKAPFVIARPVVLPLSCVALLVFSCGADAFATIAAGGGATKRGSRPIVPRRVLILPDSRANVSEDRELWHHHLKVSSCMLLGAGIYNACTTIGSCRDEFVPEEWK